MSFFLSFFLFVFPSLLHSVVFLSSCLSLLHFFVFLSSCLSFCPSFSSSGRLAAADERISLSKKMSRSRGMAQKKWYFSESDIFESVIPSRSKAAKAHFLFKGKKPNCSKLWGGDGVATSHCEKNRIVLNFEKCLFLEPRTPLVRETDRY